MLERLSAEQLYDSLITLRYGNIDSLRNTQLKKKWNSYIKTTQLLLSDSPETIMKLNTLKDQTEKEIAHLRKNVQAIKAAKKKAQGDGDTVNVKQLSQQQSKAHLRHSRSSSPCVSS